MAHRALALAAACVVGVAGVAAGDPPATEGGAVASYQEYCRLCHRVPDGMGRQRSEAQWRDTVARMSAHRQKLRRGEIPVADQILIARHLSD